MLISALGFFTCAALLGLYLLSFVLRNKNTPKGVSITHGFFALAGIFILIIYPFMHAPFPLLSLMLFIFALMGGLMLVYRDLSGKTIPKWMALGHGLMAVSGFLTLAFFIFK